MIDYKKSISKGYNEILVNESDVKQTKPISKYISHYIYPFSDKIRNNHNSTHNLYMLSFYNCRRNIWICKYEHRSEIIVLYCINFMHYYFRRLEIPNQKFWMGKEGRSLIGCMYPANNLEDSFLSIVTDVTFVPASRVTGRVEASDVVAAIRPSTCMVTVMTANNETGIIQVS